MMNGSKSRLVGDTAVASIRNDANCRPCRRFNNTLRCLSMGMRPSRATVALLIYLHGSRYTSDVFLTHHDA